jgi:hypothetical protein
VSKLYVYNTLSFCTKLVDAQLAGVMGEVHKNINGAACNYINQKLTLFT